MSVIRDATRVSGSLMDVARLVGLSDNDCNVLLVSSRTLYLMTNYGDTESTFLARYYTQEFDGGLVEVVQPDDPEEEFVREISNRYKLEVIPVTCDLVQVLENIAVAINGLQLAGCCPPQGSNPPQPTATEGQPPPAGYIEYDPLITDRKCKLANMAVDDLLQVIEILIANNAETIANFTVALMSVLWTLVVSLIAAGPVAWALAGLGAVASLIGFFLVNELNLTNLKALIEANRTDLVCALFLATDNVSGYNDFRTVLDGAGAEALDLLFLDTLNFLDGLATLFFAPEGGEGEAIEARLDGYPITTDCEQCGAPLATDWVLLPDGVLFGETTGTGTMGSGDIIQTGEQFILTAVERTDNPGTYVVAMVVKGFLDAQIAQGTPNWLPESGSWSGVVTRHSALPSNPSQFGRRVDAGDCDTDSLGMCNTAPPCVYNNMQLIYYAKNAPFTVTYSITTPPLPCP